MKKITFQITFIFFSIWGNAQFSLDHTFTDQSIYDISYVQLESSGKKLYTFSIDGEQIGVDLYNLDYSLYKSITINLSTLFLVDYKEYQFNVYYLAEHLFDLDDEVEILAELYYEDNDNYPYIEVLVYNEDGTLLFETDVVNNNSWIISPSFNGYSVPGSIYNTSDGTKMIIGLYDVVDTIYKYEVYNLEGTLSSAPLNKDIRSMYPSGYLKASPNPANTQFNVEYKLTEGEETAEVYIYDVQGKPVKRFSITSREGKIHVTTTDMPAGTYIYEMKTNRRGYTGRPVIVVK